MIAFGTIQVHAELMPAGQLFLWAELASGSVLEAAELKTALFAWHAPSFYGTFIETADFRMKEGVTLPAAEALAYFDGGAALEHVRLQWDGELAELMRHAAGIREALEQRRFMPDFASWKSGKPGWKLELPDAEGAPLVQGVAAALARESAGGEGELEERLARLTAGLPAGGPDVWLDEDDWLVALGWQADASPFRTGLQLVEPETPGRPWRLQVLLQGREEPDLLVPCSAAGEPLEAGADGAAELPAAWRPALARAAKDVRRWLHIVPWLREREGGAAAAARGAIDGGVPSLRSELDDDEAWRFLADASLKLLEAGCVVFLPSWWDRVRRVKPRLKAKVKTSVGSVTTSLFGLQQMVQFDWKLAIGDLELTEEEFRRLIEQKRNLVHFRGRWVQLDPAELERIRETMKQVNRRKGLSLRDVLEARLLGEARAEQDALADDRGADAAFDLVLPFEVELNDQLSEWISELKGLSGVPTLEPPGGFHGSLRHYQQDGFSWMVHLRRFGLGCCLADDMGLGKTIQWISYLLHVKEQEPGSPPALLICPTSVLGNWQKELQRFAPSLRIHLHYGPQRLRGKAFVEAACASDVVLVSYTLAHLDEAQLGELEWSCICLDEAQNIKNAYTKQASSIRRLSGSHRIAMTGTPIENRLTELWSIFDFLNPGYLGSLREFTTRFVTPIERTGDAHTTGQVQRLVKPFLLRRLKKDPAIQLDLPEKTESKTYVSLTAEQASLYEAALQGMFDGLESMSAMERRGHILSALTRLKQVCNHPALYLKEPIGAGVRWQERSGKLERLVDMVRELRAEGDRCLIFTQFVETGHLLQEVLRQELGESPRFLHGGTPRAVREQWIQAFQAEDEAAPGAFSIFLLSLKAGGVGLNLTAANHVFHYDRWWNPAVENQATDRAYRIGQTRHVQVHKFVTLGTLEERINDMIERKQELSRQVVGSGESWITELSTDELKELFVLRQEWVTS